MTQVDDLVLSKLFNHMDNKNVTTSKRVTNELFRGLTAYYRWTFDLGGHIVTTIAMSGWNPHPHKDTNMGHAYFIVFTDHWETEYHWSPETGRAFDDWPVMIKGSMEAFEKDMLYAKMLLVD
jgi:hypothetical protein